MTRCKRNQLLISRTDQLQSALHEVEVSATAQAEDHARQVDAISLNAPVATPAYGSKERAGGNSPFVHQKKRSRSSLCRHTQHWLNPQTSLPGSSNSAKKDADSGAYLTNYGGSTLEKHNNFFIILLQDSSDIEITFPSSISCYPRTPSRQLADAQHV